MKVKSYIIFGYFCLLLLRKASCSETTILETTPDQFTTESLMTEHLTTIDIEAATSNFISILSLIKSPVIFNVSLFLL
jgi:hypothetical protein